MLYTPACSRLFETCACPAIRVQALGRAEDRGALETNEGVLRLLKAGAAAARAPDFNRNIHGGTACHLENCMPMLLDRGLDRTFSAFDAAFSPLLSLFDGSALTHVIHSFLPIILSPWLLWAGYRGEGLMRFFHDRLRLVADFCAREGYDIYAQPGVYKGVPKPFRDRRIIRPALYENGCHRLPLIYDLYAYRALYVESDSCSRALMDTVLSYVLADGYQALDAGYGILYAGPGHYYAMGWDARLPALEDGLTAAALHRLELLNAFPQASDHPWTARCLEQLSRARRDDGVYDLPDAALIERDAYWVTGAHMSLGENRRRRTEKLACGTCRALRLLSRTQSTEYP